jgi:hypothetical protein
MARSGIGRWWIGQPLAAVLLGAGLVAVPASAAPPANGRYVVNAAQKVVFDKVTGLTWQRESPVTGGSSGQTTGRFNWADAKQYCANLELGGHTDWRLPGIAELLNLVRQKTTGTAIDAVAFPNTPVSGTDRYWSATPYQGGSSSAWCVYFNGGYSYVNGVTSSGRVRCVR